MRSVTILGWTGAHGAFAVETLFKTDESVIATQRIFRAHFMLRQNYVVLDRDENFQGTDYRLYKNDLED